MRENKIHNMYVCFINMKKANLARDQTNKLGLSMGYVRPWRVSVKWKLSVNLRTTENFYIKSNEFKLHFCINKTQLVLNIFLYNKKFDDLWVFLVF